MNDDWKSLARVGLVVLSIFAAAAIVCQVLSDLVVECPHGEAQ